MGGGCTHGGCTAMRAWAVHAQCTHVGARAVHVWGGAHECMCGGCMCNAHMGVHVGVHAQCARGGCMHNVCMGVVTPIN